MATRVKIEYDTVDCDAKPMRQIRTLYVQDDEGGAQTIVVRTYGGSVDIRTNGASVNIDAYAIPGLIRELRDAAKEA